MSTAAGDLNGALDVLLAADVGEVDGDGSGARRAAEAGALGRTARADRSGGPPQAGLMRARPIAAGSGTAGPVPGRHCSGYRGWRRIRPLSALRRASCRRGRRRRGARRPGRCRRSRCSAAPSPANCGRGDAGRRVHGRRARWPRWRRCAGSGARGRAGRPRPGRAGAAVASARSAGGGRRRGGARNARRRRSGRAPKAPPHYRAHRASAFSGAAISSTRV